MILYALPNSVQELDEDELQAFGLPAFASSFSTSASTLTTTSTSTSSRSEREDILKITRILASRNNYKCSEILSKYFFSTSNINTVRHLKFSLN